MTEIEIKRTRDKGVKPTKAFRKPPEINSDIIDAHTWYCLRTAPQKEFRVQDILNQSGFMSYVPTREEYKFRDKVAKAKRKKTRHTYPMLVGYLLIGFHPHQMHKGHTPYWTTLLDQELILGALGIDGSPLPINRKSIHDFSERYPNGLQRPQHEKFMRTHGEFAVGDTVRVCEGPFDGLHVPVVNLSNDKANAVIRVEMFGGEREIRIDTFSLEKAA